MALYLEGSGNKGAPTIIFIHGGGVSSWIWKKQLEYFKDYHCLALDLPEHGKSINAGQISIQDSALQIAEIIEKYANGSKAHLIGHSLGAKVIVELLSCRPELVDHAIIASALFRPVPLMKLSHKPFVYKFTAYLLKRKWVTSLSIKQYRFPDKTFAANYRQELQGLTAGMLYRIYDELYKNLSLPKELAKAAVPTLLIAGEKEPQEMRESVLDMLAIMPEARGIFIKEGFHTYPWALYGEFNKIVEDWINDKQTGYDFVISVRAGR
ncbi:MAG: alpha/beta fold hydrolase [Peptococcaceae bacterium]